MKKRTYIDVFGESGIIGDQKQSENIKTGFHSDALVNELEVLVGKTIKGFYSTERKLIIYLEDDLVIHLTGGSIEGEDHIYVDAELLEESEFKDCIKID